MTTTHATGTPHPALRAVVLRYEGYTQKSVDPVAFCELPCSYVPVIIDLDAGWTIAQAGRPGVRHHSFVAGITDAPVFVSHGGSASCLQVDLTALGARRLLGLPMHELANRTVDIVDVLGRDGQQLVQRIGELPDWPGRFALVDNALRTRLAEAPEIDTGLAWSYGRIVTTAGAASIGELAAELGWSHRRLIARYRDVLGLPPKTVARIVRFETLTAHLRGAQLLDWATVAVECGFYDQAHLSREVRELTGQTPTQLVASMVNSVQDEAAARA